MADNVKTIEDLCREHGIDVRQLAERADSFTVMVVGR